MILEEREKAVLGTLSRLPKKEFVLIGGYAINAYTPPRYSLDCDLVLLRHNKEILGVLEKEGYVKKESGKNETPYGGEFMRYEKDELKVSFDLLIGEVLDRKTRISLPADFILNHSKERATVGRAVPDRILLRIANPEVLFILKFIASRKQDIRDMFMLSHTNLKHGLIINTLKEKMPEDIVNKNVAYIKDVIKNPSYRDSLQGAYGALPEGLFDSCQKKLSALLSELSIGDA